MLNNYFYIASELGEKSIKIRPSIEYNTLKIIDSDTPLIKSNVFSIARGVKWYDFIQFSNCFSFAISKKVKQLLESNQVTGWSCFPIVIEGKGRNKEYFVFQTLGKAGPILNLEAVNRYEADHSEFDLSTWDGSDFFNLKDTLISACTLRVKELLESAKLTNLEIRPL